MVCCVAVYGVSKYEYDCERKCECECCECECACEYERLLVYLQLRLTERRMECSKCVSVSVGKFFD